MTRLGWMVVLVALTAALWFVELPAQSPTTRWVARVSDGAWVLAGYGDPTRVTSDPDYIYVDVIGTTPNPRLERYAPALSGKRRLATAAEIAAYDAYVLENEIARTLDDERLISAVVWTVIETLNPPATRAKYLAARTKIVTAYTTQPWKP